MVVVARELGYVAHGDVEVLVPRTFGLEAAERRAPTPTHTPRAWDEASFDAALREFKGEAVLEVATHLRRWAIAPEVGLDVSFGRGATFGTEGFGLPDPSGTRRALFSLWTSGGAELALANLKFFPTYAGLEARLDVLHALARVDGRTRKDAQADGWPQFGAEVLLDATRLEEFKILLRDVLGRIRGGSPRAD